MGENKQKHVTTGSKSKYAIKHEAQNRGIFSVNSPFGSRKDKQESEAVKVQENPSI